MKTIDFESIVKESFAKRNRVLTEDAILGLGGVMQFAIDLMFKAQIFHVWHLNCNIMADHLVLKDTYEALEAFADTVVESVIGITDQVAADAERVYKISIDPWAKDLAIQSLLEIKSEAETLMTTMEGEEGIKNTFAGFVEKLDGFVYKLKRFVS